MKSCTPLCSSAASENSSAEDKSKWILWAVGSPCWEAVQSLVLFAARLAEKSGEIWPFLMTVLLVPCSFLRDLAFAPSPTRPVLPLQTITAQNPTCSPAQPESRSKIPGGHRENPGMGQELDLKLRCSLGSAESQGRVVTGVPGAAGQGSGGLWVEPAPRGSIFIQNIYPLVFMSPCLFWERCCIPTGISLWCFFSL